MADSYGTRAWVSAPALLLGVMGAMAAAMADAPADPAAPASPASPASPAAGSDWRATVRDFAAKHFKNPAWGYSHCRRDYALARELAAADHVTLDDDVLFARSEEHTSEL